MFNRAMMMGLPSGSTWKPFMALIGLQEGVVTQTSIYHDHGCITVAYAGRAPISSGLGPAVATLNASPRVAPSFLKGF